jgi:hypothetical protein
MRLVYDTVPARAACRQRAAKAGVKRRRGAQREARGHRRGGYGPYFGHASATASVWISTKTHGERGLLQAAARGAVITAEPGINLRAGSRAHRGQRN